jgi:hypothetical protein
MAVQSVCDSPLRALFYPGTAGLDSGPVTAGVAPFIPALAIPCRFGTCIPPLERRRECHPSKPSGRPRSSNEQLPTRFREGE